MDRVKWDTPYFKVWDGNSNKFWKGWCNPVNGIDEMYCGNVRALIFLRPTGLKDKNGVEIYEGDIIKAENHKPSTYEIKFIEGGFCATRNDDDYQIDINLFYPSVGCMIEVIGNIYENPELLDNSENI